MFENFSVGFRGQARPAAALVALAAASFACLPARPAPPAQRAAGGHHAPFSGDKGTPMGIPIAPAPGAWLTRPWTGDSAALTAAEQDVKRQVRSRGFTEVACRAVCEHERAAAQATPLDLMAAYRWLVAATQVAYFSGVMDHDALERVALLDPGTFRQIARTRLVALIGPESEADASHPALAGLEERLMRTDPSDLWVRGHAIRDLANGHSTPARGVALADQWVRQMPGSDQAHLMRAHVALLQWFWGHQSDRAVAERAVAEYGQYLRLAPQDAPGRAGAKSMAARVAQAAGIPVAAH